MEKLTKKCVFSVNDKLVNQIDGCSMDGAISVIMHGVHMKKAQKDCVLLFYLKLYNCYVEGFITKIKHKINRKSQPSQIS